MARNGNKVNLSMGGGLDKLTLYIHRILGSYEKNHSKYILGEMLTIYTW